MLPRVVRSYFYFLLGLYFLPVFFDASIPGFLKILPSQATVLASEHLGNFGKWSRVEITLNGPMIDSTSSNPFRIPLSAIFTGPSSQSDTVPGFYDGDGLGSNFGDLWKVRFSPDEIGAWQAVTVSTDSLLDSLSFTFEVTASGQHGLLQYVGDYYLKYADGPYWFKSGSDDPENYLGEGIFGAWPDKLTALDYLAGKGVNSLFISLLDYPKDSGLVYPWLTVDDQEHYDLAKWHNWEMVLEHAADLGIVLHLCLEDDGAVIPLDRDFYYRWIIARLSHINAIQWNIREEYNEKYTDAQAQQYAAQLRSIDPYDHPITLHDVNTPVAWFLNNPLFSLTCIQTPKPSALYPPSYFNNLVLQWRQASASRPITISIDEAGRTTSSEEDRHFARKMEWAIALAGGVFELHAWPIPSFQDFDAHWNDMMHLRNFIQALPFQEMAPANSLITGSGFCLRQSGQNYAVYAPEGGALSLNLTGISGVFCARWYEPLTGVYHKRRAVTAGSAIALQAPWSSDAAVMLQKTPMMRIRAMLQGSFRNTGLLAPAAHIPLSSPYGAAPVSVTEVPQDAADWILLELRSQASGPAVLNRSLFLRQDGWVTDINTGDSLLTFPNLAQGNYYVVLRHRNHAAVMSSQTIAFTTQAVATADLTTGAEAVYGSNGSVELAEGIWGLWAGDANQDQLIQSSDFNAWQNDARLDVRGYCTTDFNMDGQTTSRDAVLWYKNFSSGAAGQVP